MLAALNGNTGVDSEKLLRNVRKAVDGFVKDAEQFDDLTMLGFEFKGTRGEGHDRKRIENRGENREPADGPVLHRAGS